MAQSNIITRERATYIGLESTYGSTPAASFPNAMTRIICIDDSEARDPQEEMLDVADERVRRADAIQPVHGLQIASKFSLKAYLKSTPQAAQLVAGATPGSLSPRIVLRHALGTEYADEGSTVATGTSSTVFDVQPGDGALFRVGTFIAVAISGQMEWAEVTAISTDTITVSPALSGTPSTSAVVRNLYNYAMAESHISSVTVQQANVGASTAQYTFNGAFGDIAFELPEFGKLPSMTLSLTATAYTGPSSQAISVASASDDMGPAFAWAPAVFFAAPGGGGFTRSSPLVVESVRIEFANQWEMVRDPSAAQTVKEVVNVGGRPRAVKAMIQLRFDADYETAFNADTTYRLVIVQRIGTGANASFWVLSLPTCKLTTVPKPTKVGERFYLDLEVSGLQDAVATVTTETGTDLDLVLSPFKVAFG